MKDLDDEKADDTHPKNDEYQHMIRLLRLWDPQPTIIGVVHVSSPIR